MKLKTENAITIIALIITIILILILVGVGIHFGNYAINKARLEDIKTDMISIKTKAKIIVDQYNFKDIENLVGTQITQEEADKINVDITSNGDKIKKWSSDDLTNQGLSKIEGDEYVVKYNLDDPNNCEVYYLKGYEGIYSLTELQDI